MLITHAVRGASGFCLAIVGSVLILCLTPSLVSANTIYQYVGETFETINDFTPPAGTYTTAMSVTGQVELAAALAPNLNLGDPGVLSYSFYDGRSTLTQANSTIVIGFGTDSQGAITEWIIRINAGDPNGDQEQIQTNFFDINDTIISVDNGQISICVAPNNGGCDQHQGDLGGVSNNPGTWAVVPEPSTALLFMSGLIGVAAWNRRVL